MSIKPDPLESHLANTLEELNIKFRRDEPTVHGTIDFYLPDQNVFIEVCQFHTDRKIRQLSCVKDVILIQGANAVDAFIRLLGGITAMDVYCPDTMSEDGGSCGERIKCTGIKHKDGSFSGGCGEPCSFVMERAGQ